MTVTATDPRIIQLAPDDAGLWRAMGDGTPTHSTLPTPGALHDLAQVQLVGRAMGQPNMPWQDWTTRIATERREDDPRQYRYKLVIITVPRQSGKTTLLGNLLTTRALVNRGRRAFYTAQTGKDATARWKDLADRIAASPIGNHVTLRRAIGSQSLTFPNGSFIQPFAPTPKSLHGYTPHDVAIDEVFAFDAAQGTDLMGAIGPAQVTLPDRQLFLVSTKGTADSVFLNDWIDAGREAAKDPQSSIAYIEHSQPEGLDPDNPDHWGFHPALGHTVTKESLLELHEQHRDSPGEWRRAFMNVQTLQSESLFDMEAFRALETPQTPPEPSQMTVAYEVAMDRSRAAVMAAWIDPVTKQPAVRPLKIAGGDEWVAGFVAQIRDDLKPRTIGADDGGPTRSVTDQLRGTLAGAPWLEIIGPRDLATGWDQFKSRVRRKTISHNGDAGGLVGSGLIAAADVVTERTMGQGYAPDRMKSRGPIPEIVAATVALRLLENGPAPAPAPMIRF